MKIPPSLLRFVLEAGFLVVVAAAAAIARLSALAIVLAMGVAWLLVALVERTATRDRSAIRSGRLGFLFGGRIGAESAAPAEPEVAGPPERRRSLPAGLQTRRAEGAPASPLKADPHTSHVRVTPVMPDPAAEPEPATAPAAETAPGPEPPTAPQPAAEAPPEPDPQPEPPPPPDLREVPPPPPPAVESGPAPDAAVVAFVPRTNGPRRWNLWDLERMARDREGADTVRDQERAMLLMQLRQFANADGMLSEEFDGLVRESFRELIGSAWW